MEDRHLHCEKRSDGNMDAKCKKESNELKKKKKKKKKKKRESRQLNKEQKHLKEIATPDY
jgi:hypothetical protein